MTVTSAIVATSTVLLDSTSYPLTTLQVYLAPDRLTKILLRVGPDDHLETHRSRLILERVQITGCGHDDYSLGSN